MRLRRENNHWSTGKKCLVYMYSPTRRLRRSHWASQALSLYPQRQEARYWPHDRYLRNTEMWNLVVQAVPSGQVFCKTEVSDECINSRSLFRSTKIAIFTRLWYLDFRGWFLNSIYIIYIILVETSTSREFCVCFNSFCASYNVIGLKNIKN